MKSLGSLALDSARRKGADMAEVYLSNNRELFIEVRDGRVETMKLAGERGLGLRLMKGNRVGFAYTSDLNPESVREAVDQALVNAASTAEDPFRVMPGPAPRYPELDLYDRRIIDTPVEEKIVLAGVMEEAARKHDPRIKIIEGSSYTDAETEITLMNSLGVDLSYRGAYCGLYISLVAVQGEESQTGFALNYSLKYGDLDAGATGREAAVRAVRMLGAKTVPSQKVPVLLEPYVATGFLGLLAPALTAEAVQKGRSLFAGKVGRKVASDRVSITDDGSLPGGIASASFDGEGVPTSRTELVSGGVLRGFLHNTYTASKEGVKSTGNGVRGSFKSTPEVGATNFFIDGGAEDPGDMIAGLKKGFYVTEVLGMHTANPISGDFSLGAAGLMIENGRIAYPVRGVALAGNIIEMMKKIEGVGNDLTFFGGRGAPTILIGEMALSGH
ncbi:MAG: TldD/PmbA family protein [Peptococcaceae bacterium]|nr:TldD/PmbA family protein [Peptococcaceae bacterium]